jgi:hypothetical protein
MEPFSFMKEIREADLVITFRYNFATHNYDIAVIKDRSDRTGRIDLAGLLERAFPYQEKYLHPVIKTWINKLKIYRLFS